MELYDQIRKIAFVFFVVLGLGHFLAGLFFVNGYSPELSLTTNRVLFIPFVISAYTFGFAHLKYRLIEYGANPHWLTPAAISLGTVIFLTLLIVEIFIPDGAHPLLSTMTSL
ncbi:hypothetical protein CO046_02235 [Candidatus Peregrinibacteria bacterium CG_4_9_14_0_2_um_filter_53_11]|nr:MAG: hypothetical protein CO046_02235 [Candidatus Peregrinibacteria bacterium CG_4_9_14_0_2_um_filter_53_11]